MSSLHRAIFTKRQICIVRSQNAATNLNKPPNYIRLFSVLKITWREQAITSDLRGELYNDKDCQRNSRNV